MMGKKKNGRYKIIILDLSLEERMTEFLKYYSDRDMVIKRKVNSFVISLVIIIICITLYLISQMILGLPYLKDFIYGLLAILILCSVLFLLLRGYYSWASNIVLFILLFFTGLAVFNGETLSEQKIYNMAFLQSLALFFSIMIATRSIQIFMVGTGIILWVTLFLLFKLFPAAGADKVPYLSSYFTMIFFTLMETGVGLSIFHIMNSALEESQYRSEHDNASDLPNEKKLSRVAREESPQNHPRYLLFYKIENYTELLLNMGSKNALSILVQSAAFIRGIYDAEIFRVAPDVLCLLVTDSAYSIKEKNQKILKHYKRPVHMTAMNTQLLVRSAMLESKTDSENMSEMLNQGFLTLYQAQQDKKSFMEFKKDNEEKLRYRLNILYELTSAISKETFRMHYQPIVDSQKKILSFEALSRWTRDNGENISPQFFIPLLEKAGMMNEFFTLTLTRTLQDIKEYPELFGNRPVFINLSPELINHDFDFSLIVKIIDKSGVPYKQLGFEITETSLADDVNLTSQVIQYLSDKGFILALDDFGVGYSNLSQVLFQNFNKIKIDRSFLADISVNQQNQHLLKLLIAFFKDHEYISLVEGIETEKEFSLMKSFGCTQFQGYLFARPEDPKKLYIHLQEKGFLPKENLSI